MHFRRHHLRHETGMSLKLHAIMKFVIFLYITISTKLVHSTRSSCDTLFPKDKNGLTLAKTINQGSDLNNYLSDSNNHRNNALFKLNIINGTIWLSHSGDVRSFSPVLGTPPATSSDMSLATAMEKLAEITSSPPPRVLLSYQPEEIGDWSKHAISEYTKVIPTWSPNMYLSNDIYDNDPLTTNTSHNGTTNSSTTYEMMDSFKLSRNKKYGLDVVFDRVLTEDILMIFDFNRIKKILSTFFMKSGSSRSENAISDPDALYLRRKYRTIERNHKNTFTELFLSNLVHLLPEDKGDNGGEFARRSRPRKSWKRPAKSKIEFLPDLQKVDVVYSKEDVSELKRFLTEQLKSKRTCTLVEVRAGIFLQNESLLNLADVLKDESLDFQIYVKSEPYDTLLDVNALSSAMKIVGENRLVVDFPQDLHNKLEKISTQIRTPGRGVNSKTTYRDNVVSNGIDRSDTILSSGSSSFSNYRKCINRNLDTMIILAITLKLFL